MRRLVYGFLFFVVIIQLSCRKDMVHFIPPETEEPEMNPTDTSKKITIELDGYKLLQSSLDTMPYNGKQRVLFVDSVRNTLILNISEQDKIMGNPIRYKYNVFEQGDTVAYKYGAEFKRFEIYNENEEIYFDHTLKTHINPVDTTEVYVADALTIFYKVPDSPSYYAAGIFFHFTAQRTHPDIINSATTVIPEMVFIGKTFQDVWHRDVPDPTLKLYYNYEVGIVAFRDESGRLWRFDRFLE